MRLYPKPTEHDTSGDDASLVARIREGDAEAFAFLVRRHAEKSYRIAYRFTASRTDAEDMVQDAFITFWEQPERFDASRGVRFSTWFTRVVINRCLDAKRRTPPLPLEMALHVHDGSIPADARLIAHQQQSQLETHIALLPERQRIALNLCFYEGLSNKDAAEVMQLPVKAVQSLLMRAKTQLKDRLQGGPDA